MKNFIFVPSSTHKLIDLSTKPKFSSLEDWKFRPVVKPVSYIGRKAYVLEKQARRLSWDFISTDFINPPSCQASRLPNFRKRCAFAFTMAEILISLTIIGVIAAITLPSLKANINEKTWATQRKALYSRMSQAISMLPSLNGYGEYAGTWENDVVTVEKDTAAAKFVTDGLAKILNINNICTIPFNMSSENARKELKKCGIPEKITNMANSKLDFPTKLSELNPYFVQTYSNQWVTAINPQKNIDTVVTGFETKNGESIAVFYNPLCKYGELSITLYPQQWMCANFIYDLNGKKGPNKAGKDIGVITAFYPTDSVVVAPMPLTAFPKREYTSTYTMNANKAAAACQRLDKDSRVPNIEEASALGLNINLYMLNYGGNFWTSKLYPDIQAAYHVSESGAYLRREGYGQLYHVRCIKR